MTNRILEDLALRMNMTRVLHAKFPFIQSVYKISPCHSLGHMMLQLFLTLFKVGLFSLSPFSV